MDLLIFLAISFILGFMTGWLVHKHEYGEISDEEYFRKKR